MLPTYLTAVGNIVLLLFLDIFTLLSRSSPTGCPSFQETSTGSLTVHVILLLCETVQFILFELGVSFNQALVLLQHSFIQGRAKIDQSSVQYWSELSTKLITDFSAKIDHRLQCNAVQMVVLQLFIGQPFVV